MERKISIGQLCDKVSMSRQNFYKEKQKMQEQEFDDAFIKKLVDAERSMQSRLGGRKLYGLIRAKLANRGIHLGRDRFFKWLKDNGLLVSPRAKKPRTTNSYHCLPVHTNKVKDMRLTHPNQAWASDITYLRTQQGFVYLSLITDMFSRKIVGYHVDDTLETQGCIKALDKAFKDLPQGSKPVHHSDRGSQYCSRVYIQKLQKRGLGISMTEVNHCYENALAERVNGILKQEYYLDFTFANKKRARRAVREAIDLYNNRRPHRSLNYQFPQSVHQRAA